MPQSRPQRPRAQARAQNPPHDILSEILDNSVDNLEIIQVVIDHKGAIKEMEGEMIDTVNDFIKAFKNFDHHQEFPGGSFLFPAGCQNTKYKKCFNSAK